MKSIGASGYLGQGRAYPDLVEALCDRTRGLEATAVVWSLHFPPDNAVPSSLRLLDGEHVLAAAKDVGVEVLLAGHLHEFRRFPADPDRVEGFCAASTAVIGEPVHSLHVLEVEVHAHHISRFAYSNFDYSESRENFGWAAVHRPKITRLRESVLPR